MLINQSLLVFAMSRICSDGTLVTTDISNLRPLSLGQSPEVYQLGKGGALRGAWGTTQLRMDPGSQHARHVLQAE